MTEQEKAAALWAADFLEYFEHEYGHMPEALRGVVRMLVMESAGLIKLPE